MTKQHKWTIILQNGESWVEDGDYFFILDKIYEHFKVKKPKDGKLANMLFRDGELVIQANLLGYVLQYVAKREEYVIDAITKARMECKPSWLEVE